MGIRRNCVVVKMLPSTSILSCAETKSNGYVDSDLKVNCKLVEVGLGY